MDVKFEGLNGQLPNLDLVTLVNKMCIKEGLQITLKNRANFHPQNDRYRHWKHSFGTMMSMVLSQSTGIPTGNHGLYLRFGIQAVTMHGFLKPNSRGNQIGFFSVGKILEGIFRSLNNLLERFHQSYFFYLLPSTDRFISIIWFIPVLCLLVGCLLIRSMVQWYQVCYNPYLVDDDADSKAREKPAEWNKILFMYFITHVGGVLLMNSPSFITFHGAEYGYNTDLSLFYSFGFLSVFSLILPYLFRVKRKNSLIMLNMFVVWELAMVLLGVGMINFSLGVLCSFVIVPVALLITPCTGRLRAWFQTFLWFLVHPFVILNIIVLIYTFFMFPNSKIKETFNMGVSAAKQALVFSIVDSIVYGNWIFDVVCCIFLPVWLCMCCLIMSLPYKGEENEEIKEKTDKQKTE